MSTNDLILAAQRAFRRLGMPADEARAVSQIIVGLDWKASCRAASTATLTLSGEQTIDGVAVLAGDRVLVKAQTAGAENGIYVASASTWARAEDANTSAQVTSGLAVFVEEGAVNADAGWTLITNNPITLDTTALSFTQFNGLGSVTAGAGLTKTGNTLDVGAGTGITAGADTVSVDTSVIATKAYADALSGTTPADGTFNVVGAISARPSTAAATSEAFGEGATTGTYARGTALGYQSTVNAADGTADGYQAIAGTSSTAVGSGAQAATSGVETSCVAVGKGAGAPGTYNTVIGTGSNVSPAADSATAVGAASVAGNASTVVGRGSRAGNDTLGTVRCVTMGRNATSGHTAAASKCTAVGDTSDVEAVGGTALGCSATIAAGHDYSIAVGCDATTTGAGNGQWGSAGHPTTLAVHARVYSAEATPLNLGVAAVTSHALDGDDTLVGGDLEVNGFAYFDMPAIVASALEVNGADSADSIIYNGIVEGQLPIGVGSNHGRQLLLLDRGQIASDYAHAAQTNPTLYVHSATAPGSDITQYAGLQHDATDAALLVGKGRLNCRAGDAGSVTPAAVTHKRPVVDRATALGLAVGDSGTLYTNVGAGSRVDLTLPAIGATTIGTFFTFACEDADGLRIIAPASTTLQIGSTATSVAGYVESTTIGSVIKLVAVSATRWVAETIVATWATA